MDAAQSDRIIIQMRVETIRLRCGEDRDEPSSSKEFSEMQDGRDHQNGDEDDAVVRALKACGIAVTRANYLKLIYGDELPEKWGPELEGQLPKYLQDWTQVDRGTMKRGIKKSGRRRRKR